VVFKELAKLELIMMASNIIKVSKEKATYSFSNFILLLFNNMVIIPTT